MFGLTTITSKIMVLLVSGYDLARTCLSTFKSAIGYMGGEIYTVLYEGLDLLRSKALLIDRELHLPTSPP